MRRLRRVCIGAVLTMTALAACTLSPLNPQPLPPKDDFDPDTTGALDAGWTRGDSGERGVDQAEYDAALPATGADSDAAPDGSTQHVAGSDASTDASDASTDAPGD